MHSYASSDNEGSVTKMNWSIDIALARRLVSDAGVPVNAKAELLIQHTVGWDADAKALVLDDALDVQKVFSRSSINACDCALSRATRAAGKAQSKVADAMQQVGVDGLAATAGAAGGKTTSRGATAAAAHAAAAVGAFDAIRDMPLRDPRAGQGPVDVVNAQVRQLHRWGMPSFTREDVIAATQGARPAMEDLRRLTRCQQQALRGLLASIEARDGKWHLLTGSAGTGKTVVARIIASIMHARGMHFCQCAYTNSATAELGGDKSFEAVLGTAFIKRKLRVADTLEVSPGQVYDYVQRAAPHVLQDLGGRWVFMMVDEARPA